jgi:hypothetical protein
VERPVDVSLRDARRMALWAQGFGERRPKGRSDRRHFRKVLDQLATVQLDSVNVLTRSHELVFFSRLGAYDRAALTKWLWSSREVFEYWGHEASLHPVSRHPLFAWRMADGHRWDGVRTTGDNFPELVASVLAEVVERGPLTTSEIEARGPGRQRTEAWWGWTDHKRVIEYLFWSGQVAATRRGAFERVYLLPSQWLPAPVLAGEPVSERDAQRELLLVAARSVGIGTAGDLADYYRINRPLAAGLVNELAEEGLLVRAAVDGWKQPAFFLPHAHLPRRRMRHRALLSPFDSLIWERQRTERLWDFLYRIEIYVPRPKRVFGYYVLPFLLDEALVGRVDLKADRQAGLLRVQAAWIEPGPAGKPASRERVASELAAELGLMAAWLGLDGGVEVVGRGDLAPDLARAVAAGGTDTDDEGGDTVTPGWGADAPVEPAGSTASDVVA